jgi:hypothetical protein
MAVSSSIVYAVPVSAALRASSSSSPKQRTRALSISLRRSSP